MFSYTYEPRYGDWQDTQNVKIGMLLDAVQDVAVRDSARCGYDGEKLKQQGFAWLLKGIRLRLLKPVSPHSPITVQTAVKAMKGATSERGCILMQQEEVVAETIADWFLFDINQQRIARIPKDMADAYDLFAFSDWFTFQKPNQTPDTKPLYTVRVGRKDMDTNRHLNNQRGADMLMDALPLDFAVSELTILYRKQVYAEAVLTVRRGETEQGYVVELVDETGDTCLIGTFSSSKTGASEE